MNLLCNFFVDLWDKIYNACFRSLDNRTKTIIGVVLIFVGMSLFILSTKGSKKGQMVGSWFIFWLSAICLVLGVVYVSI